MAVYKQKGSKNWWYKFTWHGERIRETTKQTNKRIAEQMEAAHKTALAKGEVGIRERKAPPTLREFAERDFLPFVRSQFADKPQTLSYYENGLKSLTGIGAKPSQGRAAGYAPLASCRLDQITPDKIAGFVAEKRAAKLAVASLNRQLEVLRRMFKLAQEWGK